ncbi:MAG: DUF1573 domain-containing protein [Rikenellaceae bacterium]
MVTVVVALIGATVAVAQTPHIEKMLKIANPDLASGAEQIHFSSLNYDLGEISEDDPVVSGEFKMLNKGSEPIVILRATASCSCVTLQYPKTPIIEGQEATIQFRYNPKGYPGKINRRVMLYTNLSESAPTAVLTISGEATPSQDNSLHYPYSLGELRMRQPSVTFRDANNPSVERIVCINDSPGAMRLKVLDFQLPAGLSFRTEPEVIEAGATAEIVISHDPKLWQGGAESFPLVVSGVNVSPSRRTIDVQFEYKR